MSAAFESGRLVSTAPNMIENAPFLAGASPGGGVQEEQQGEINIKGIVDYQLLTRLFTDASGSGRQTVYPCRSPASQNVKEGEYAYTIPPTDEELRQSDLLNEQGEPMIATALGGIGKRVVAEFPDDEEAWVEWINHTAKIMGVVRGGVQTLGLESAHVSLQVSGLVWKHAEETMPAGYYSQSVARKPSELAKNDNLHRPNEAYDKTTFGSEPVRPSTYSQLIRTHVRLYLTRQRSYEGTHTFCLPPTAANLLTVLRTVAFNMGYRNTKSMAAAMQHLFTYTKMAALGVLDELIRVAGLQIVGLGAEYDPFAARAFPANSVANADDRHRLITGLAKGLGLLPDHGVAGANFDDALNDRWSALTRQSLMKVLVPNEYVQLSLGYDDATRVDRAVDVNSGEPLRDSTIGELAALQARFYILFFCVSRLMGASKQFEAPGALYANLSDIYSRIQSRITGFIVRGANQGNVFGQSYRSS
jgi:hypothetical protein